MATEGWTSSPATGARIPNTRAIAPGRFGCILRTLMTRESLVCSNLTLSPKWTNMFPKRRLDLVARSMPFLRGRFATYQSFADAGLEEILGDRLAQTHFLEANWLESTVFLNRGDHLEARVMPAEAQFAPAFAVVVADYDGAGHEDIFLSQNFFAVKPETSRYDAGRGLWLTGDGQGGLRAVPGQKSGVMVYGEQRGAAVADFDGDGRVDLVVTQNAAETRLFKNVRGTARHRRSRNKRATPGKASL
jgi:enediyne biosynthesis protein E4